MRWRMLAWICLAELGALSLWFSATAVVPALHTAWMSTGAQAWLSMAVTLGFVVGTVVSAVLTLSDYVGARRLFVVTAVAGALVNAALLVVIESLPLVLACRFLTGLAMAGTYPPAMKLAASWFVADRGLAVGSLVGALTLGAPSPT
jgi:MFS family permease